jgi:hypothetical protein
MDQQVQQFKRLFRGRGDVWGHDEGRCVKEKLTDEHWADHLTGRSGIGVYPAVPVPDGRVLCAWGCTDIDVEDYGAARLLQSTLGAAGIHSYVERSRSKGYHVWMFVSSPVSATSMRYAQLAAHQVADMKPIEVNPKQTDVTLHKYGNYVRLPYMGGLVDKPVRRVILDDDGEPMSLDQFLSTVQVNDPSLIDEVGAMYQPPKQTTVAWNLSDPSTDLAEGMRSIAPLGYVIWRDGPLEGRDRSTTLARLAHICAESGMPPSAATMVVRDADKRWGKFHTRVDGEEQIDKMIVKAYQ